MEEEEDQTLACQNIAEVMANNLEKGEILEVQLTPRLKELIKT